MDQQQQVKKAVCKIKMPKNEDEDDDELDLRRGPWTVDEDFTLINYIAHHGEGRWNSLARCAGLKRTGKSCRLRWLNYLRPDVRRGNISLEEQLLILELHSRWGNRWSKIAQHLPGRTDNEIKNYWRTRVQKHAKQLKCDVNSKQFKDTMKYLWMPRLVERIQAAGAPPPPATAPAAASSFSSTIFTHQSYTGGIMTPVSDAVDSFGTPVSDTDQSCHYSDYHQPFDDQVNNINNNNNNNSITYQDHCYHPELVDHHHHQQQIASLSSCGDHQSMNSGGINNIIGSNYFNQGTDVILDHQWNMDGGDHTSSDLSLWNNADDVWLLQHQFSSNF